MEDDLEIVREGVTVLDSDSDRGADADSVIDLDSDFSCVSVEELAVVLEFVSIGL